MASTPTPQTAIGKDELKKLNSIINNLFENQESVEFRQPVDVKGLGLTDYLTIIKTPMDLGTVKKNIKGAKYKYIEEALGDIQLIWDNCKTYNAEGSWIWKQADKLEKYSKKLIKTYLPTIQFFKGGKKDSGDDGKDGSADEVDDADGVTHQEKQKLTNKVKLLSQEQLGNIVKIIQEECPNAWKEVEKDKYQILVDNIKKDTFQKIDEYIESCTAEVIDQPSKKLKQETIKKE